MKREQISYESPKVEYFEVELEQYVLSISGEVDSYDSAFTVEGIGEGGIF